MDIAGMLLKSLGIDNPEQMKADAMATCQDAIAQFQMLQNKVSSIAIDAYEIRNQNMRIMAMLENAGMSVPANAENLEVDPSLSPQEFESASVKLIAQTPRNIAW